MRLTAIGFSAAYALALFGCEGAVPNVRGGIDKVVPSFAPPMSVALEDEPSVDNSATYAASDSEEVEDPGYCLAWETVREEYDEATGEFDYLYTCAEGGEIASSRSVGQDDGLGNGSYRTTYILRDGSEIIWDWDFETSEDGSQTWYHGASSDGEAAEIEYTFGFSGSTQTHEVWTYLDGVYRVDGVYEADGRFNGTYSFDYSDTPESPDWVVALSEDVDGTVTQVVHSVYEGWVSDYTYIVNPDNSASYHYEYDDTSTSVDPDFLGAYFYGADGPSEGGYTQSFDDGSELMVEHVFNWLEAGYQESWVFDDAGTAQEVNQEGSIVYDAEGNGSGTITTYIEGGGSETCDVTVDPDGSTLIDNCQ